MRRTTKLFSLILSLILITVSVPMSVYSENTNQIENSEQITEIQEDLTLVDESVDVQVDLDIITQADEFLEIEEEPVDMAAVSSDYEQVTGIPDGIYAIESSLVGMHYIQAGATSDYSLSITYVPSFSPHVMGSTSYLFKITKIENTEKYSIRFFGNENLTLKFSSAPICLAEIPTNNINRLVVDEFYIENTSEGFIIKTEDNGYLCGNASGTLNASEDITNYCYWKLRGYKSYVDDGVYAFELPNNTGKYIGTSGDFYESGENINLYNYDNCPIDDFSRSGMFKLNRIGDTDQYTIRLMTNNLLAWSVVDNSIISQELPENEADIPNSMRFRILYDNGGFAIIPYGTMNSIASSSDKESLSITTYGIKGTPAKWKLYRYTGEPKHGIEILNSDDFISNGAIVGQTYDFEVVCWTTNLNFHKYFLALPSKYSDAAAFNWNSEDYTASLTVNKFTDMGLYIGLYDVTNGSTSIYITDPINFRTLLEEDVAYIQNKYSEKYATILGPSTDEGKIIHQYEYHEGTQIQWMIERDSYNPEYVLFKSLFSNKYMGVSPTNSNEIRQYSTIGDNTLWKIVELDNSSYKIINKAYENSGRVLATPSGASGNGQWLTQRAYVDDGDYSDEWNIYYIKYFATVCNFYDNGYIVRYEESELDSQNNIQSYNLAVAERYMQLFGLSIEIVSPQYFESAIDVCKGAVTPENISQLCNHNGTIHTNADSVEADFESAYIATQTTTMVLWSAHKICVDVGMFNRPYSWGDYVYYIHISTSENRLIESIGMFMHELAHQYGVKDHYHEMGTDGKCIGGDRCSRCGDFPRSASCIMNNSRQDITGEDIICEDCFQEILAHLNAHHKYS